MLFRNRPPRRGVESALLRLLCLVLGHRYYVVREFNYAERKMGCRRCSRFWAMNDRVHALVPWSGEFEELYARDFEDRPGTELSKGLDRRVGRA